MRQYFPKPYERYSGNVTVELGLFNYVTKAGFKGATGVDVSNLAVKSDLASLKAEVDKVDLDKPKIVLSSLSKLSNVVDHDAVKKIVYDKLVSEVSNIDTNGFALKTQYKTDKSDIEKKINDADKKILDTSGVVIKTNYNAKITEIKGKVPSITVLATTADLSAVEIRYQC